MMGIGPHLLFFFLSVEKIYQQGTSTSVLVIAQGFPNVLGKKTQLDIVKFLWPQALTTLLLFIYFFKFQIYNIGLL